MLVSRDLPENKGRIAYAAELIAKSRSNNEAFQKQRVRDARTRRRDSGRRRQGLRGAVEELDRTGKAGVFEFELKGIRGTCPVAYSSTADNDIDYFGA